VAVYALDTSALIAYLYDEEGADTAEAVIFGGERVLIPFLAVMETEYKLLRSRPDRARRQMAQLLSWPAQIIESSPQWRAEAARIKAGGRLSLADAWAAALALLNDAELVHKDPEFDAVSGLKALRLPYALRGRGRA
jgi:predicted nucleic acid-binding protein